MRWKRRPTKVAPKPKIGDRREVCRFLFLPKCLDGEWRWFERCEVIQEFQKWKSLAPESARYIDVYGWRDAAWGKEYSSIRAWLADHPFRNPSK